MVPPPPLYFHLEGSRLKRSCSITSIQLGVAFGIRGTRAPTILYRASTSSTQGRYASLVGAPHARPVYQAQPSQPWPRAPRTTSSPRLGAPWAVLGSHTRRPKPHPNSRPLTTHQPPPARPAIVPIRPAELQYRAGPAVRNIDDSTRDHEQPCPNIAISTIRTHTRSAPLALSALLQRRSRPRCSHTDTPQRGRPIRSESDTEHGAANIARTHRGRGTPAQDTRTRLQATTSRAALRCPRHRDIEACFAFCVRLRASACSSQETPRGAHEDTA